MSWVFFFSLVTFLVAVYICKNSADEISYLSGSIAVVSLLLALVLAPWQIQGLLLMLILLSNRQRSLYSKPVVKSKSQEEETLQPVYRAANYASTSAKVEIPEGQIAGKYRGQVWRVQNSVETSLPQSSLSIKYRGASVTQ